MRAMIVREIGAPLELGELPSPVPGPGEVKIAVHRAGVNFPELLVIRGLYQDKPELPFAPGFEVAGEVMAVGGGVESVAVGERVAAYGLHGGYAEEFLAPEGAVYRLNDEIPFEVGAVTLVGYGTGYHALVDRGGLREGETLVVLGASGGTGLATVELGKILGARVLGVVSSDWKADIVRKQGADHVVNGTSRDLREQVLAFTEGRGADVIFDSVGGDALDQALRYVAWRGRVLIIGFTSGRIADIPSNRLLIKGASAVGVWWGRFAEQEPDASQGDLGRIFEWLASGVLHPHISARYPLAEAEAALEAIEARQVVGKQVLEVR